MCTFCVMFLFNARPIIIHMQSQTSFKWVVSNSFPTEAFTKLFLAVSKGTDLSSSSSHEDANEHQESHAKTPKGNEGAWISAEDK